ncbi:hypothetical protein LMIY3S_01794 [Labrys miyagiensis]
MSQLVAIDVASQTSRGTRQQAVRERRAAVASMLFEGMTTGQVAERVGVSRQAVSQMAKRNGFPVGGRGATVRVASKINCHLYPKLVALAEAAGLSPGAYLARMIKVATDDPQGHRRYMGKAGMASKPCVRSTVSHR